MDLRTTFKVNTFLEAAIVPLDVWLFQNGLPTTNVDRPGRSVENANSPKGSAKYRQGCCGVELKLQSRCAVDGSERMNSSFKAQFSGG